MIKRYFGDWEDFTKEEVLNDFDCKTEDPASIQIVLASYDYLCYEGSATVIFLKDGKLYEVNDYHCSCNGFDNWEPEETSVEALLMRDYIKENEEMKKALEFIDELKNNSSSCSL